MPKYITTNLGALGFPELITTMEDIDERMTDNPDFPSPPVPMPEINGMLTDLKKYNKQKEQLSQVERKARDKIVGKAVKALSRNGEYVVILFPEDEVKQLSSGYPSAKRLTRLIAPPDVPTDLRARNSKVSGEIIVNFKRYRGTHSLNVKIVDTATKEERIVETTSSVGVTVSGLTPGHNYDITVQALGSKGASNWSSIAVNITVT